MPELDTNLCAMAHFRQWGDDDEITIQHGDVAGGIPLTRATFVKAAMAERIEVVWTNNLTGEKQVWQLPEVWMEFMHNASERCKEERK